VKARQAKKVLKEFLRGFNIVPPEATVLIKYRGFLERKEVVQAKSTD